MTEDTTPEERKMIDIDDLRVEIDQDLARELLRERRFKRNVITPEEKLLRKIFGEDKEVELAEEIELATPELHDLGLIRVEMENGISLAEFSEILSEFNDAYASVRFLLRKLSGSYTEIYSLLSFPRVNPLPTVAQPVLAKAQFNSPGFWEVLGNLNPLKVLNDYLQQRHERKKDNDYRNELEKQKLGLENMRLRNELIGQQIESMKKVGFSDEEIKELLSKYIADPLQKLSKRIDSGQLKVIKVRSVDNGGDSEK